MGTPLDTRETLLIKIRDQQNAEAWYQFVDIYAPLIQAYLLRRGVESWDVADIVQDVLWKVTQKIADFDYNTQRGKFRAWLLTVTRHHLFDYWAADRGDRAAGGSSALQIFQDVAVANADENAWEQDYRQRVLNYALEHVHREISPLHWNVFCATAIDGKSPQEVARSTGMSVGAIYVAKSRVIKRLRNLAVEIDEGVVPISKTVANGCSPSELPPSELPPSGVPRNEEGES